MKGDWKNWILFCLPVIFSGNFVEAQVLDQTGMLRWKNGDFLPGTLLESSPEEIRWSSELFLDELKIKTDTLESIQWELPETQAEGAFQIVTLQGDRFSADLVQANGAQVTLDHPRFGNATVALSSIRSITRRDSPNLLFDGVSLNAWNSSARGPIKNLTYHVFHGNWKWNEDFPDLRQLKPYQSGSYPSGYIQTELGGMARKFAMIFEGEIAIQNGGIHLFQLRGDDIARLFLNDQLVMEVGQSNSGALSKSIQLDSGTCRLRLEFLNYGGAAYAEASWTDPDGRRQPLTGNNPNVGWFNSRELVPETEENQAELTHRLNLPDQYEILIDLSSKASPRFVLSLGEDNSGIGFRSSWSLETWDNELILLKDEIFQSVLTLENDQKHVQLRILADKKARRLLLLDGQRRLIAEFNNSDAATGMSELRLRNRGDHLHLDTLNIFKRTPEQLQAAQASGKSILYTVDGKLVEGTLIRDASTTFVSTDEETGAELDLNLLERMEIPSTVESGANPSAPVMLLYSDGSILRGTEVELNQEGVRLNVDYDSEPVEVSYDQLTVIHWRDEEEPRKSDKEEGELNNQDVFRSPKAALHGRLEFNSSNAPLTWKSFGSSDSVRLSNRSGLRIERSPSQTIKGSSVDLDAFPAVIHLNNGEAIPCSVESWNANGLEIKSPFLDGQQAPISEVRAVDFASAELIPDLDQERKERTLTVPRMYRTRPPSHILIARNGDMMRGQIRAIQSGVMVFESRSRDFEIPLDRLSDLISVKLEGSDLVTASIHPGQENHGKVRAVLSDGSSFEFTAKSIESDRMTGFSEIYGALSIPVSHIRELTIGDFESWRYSPGYQDWKLQPAKEPDFGSGSAPSEISRRPEKLIESSSAPKNVMAPKALDIPLPVVPQPVVGDPKNEGGDNGSVMLGKVRINPAERSLQFPASVNQREGLVEYALVTTTGKTHESVFKTDTDPLHIHLGLLMLKGKPAYLKELSVDPNVIPPGDEVEIFVLWQKDGQERRQRLGAFIKTANNGSPLSPAAWRYNGSIMIPSGIVAQSSGSIVALRLDAEAILNNPRPGRLNDDLHFVNTDALPEGEVVFILKM